MEEGRSKVSHFGILWPIWSYLKLSCDMMLIFVATCMRKQLADWHIPGSVWHNSPCKNLIATAILCYLTHPHTQSVEWMTGTHEYYIDFPQNMWNMLFFGGKYIHFFKYYSIYIYWYKDTIPSFHYQTKERKKKKKKKKWRACASSFNLPPPSLLVIFQPLNQL